MLTRVMCTTIIIDQNHHDKTTEMTRKHVAFHTGGTHRVCTLRSSDEYDNLKTETVDKRKTTEDQRNGDDAERVVIADKRNKDR